VLSIKLNIDRINTSAQKDKYINTILWNTTKRR